MTKRAGWLLSSALASLAVLGLGSSVNAAEPTYQFDIPAEPLGQALTDFSQASAQQILMSEDVAKGRMSKGLHGRFTSQQALDALLAGTGLHTEINSAGVLMVQPKNAEAASNDGAAFDPSGIETVMVTAEKRIERLQDTPVPVTSLNAARLVEQNQVRLQDYFSMVPGLGVNTDEFGAPQVTIRGLSSGDYNNPTVGITLDDVPYGSSSSVQFGEEALDLDPSDLSSIEVLRGPQGTLYGASSLGGLIKYTTVDPSTDGFSGRVQAGVSTVQNGTQIGYNFRASANIPLDDDLAVRVSGFQRQDPGYVDNVLTAQNGVNEGHAAGGLFLALWKPEDNLSIKLSALLQDTTSNGSPFSDPTLGDLKQNFVRGAGAFNNEVGVFSATVKAELGGIDITSVSAYSFNSLSNSFDDTANLSQYAQFYFGVSGALVREKIHTDKLTQELRFSGTAWGRVDWLLGAFYDHEHSPTSVSPVPAVDPLTGISAGDLLVTISPSTFEEYALFGDATVHLTDAFSLQLGARESGNNQHLVLDDTGPFAQPNEVGSSSGSAFTYLITPQYKFSDSMMAYARIASGYQPGGPNAGAGQAGVPLTFSPSSSTNYEVGFKGAVIDQLLILDLSLYHIDWKRIQLTLSNSAGFAYEANGGAARSEGVELSAESHPIDGLTLDGWIAYGNAGLTTPFPSSATAFGAVGDRLPYSTKFSGNISGEYNFALGESWAGVVGGNLAYVGDRIGDFTFSPDRQFLGGYAQGNIHVGVRSDAWTVNVYANNIGDRRGLLKGGIGTLTPAAFNYIQPRVVGVNVAYNF